MRVGGALTLPMQRDEERERHPQSAPALLHPQSGCARCQGGKAGPEPQTSLRYVLEVRPVQVRRSRLVVELHHRGGRAGEELPDGLPRVLTLAGPLLRPCHRAEITPQRSLTHG